MPLLFKMQETLVTVSLVLILKVRILGIPNFRETRKDTWYYKTFDERREIRKIKIHMWTVWLLTCSQALNMKKKIYKDQEPQRKEMLSLYCTVLGFISKKKEYNPKEIIPNSRYLKNLILQKVVKKRK